MSYSPRHTVVTPGRSSSGSCTLSDGRVGVASASSGRHTSGGIGNGRTNFSGRSHVGGGSTCAYGAGRGHFSSGSNSGVFVGGGHMVGNGSGAGSHVTVGSASGGHVGVVEGIPGGMVAGGHSGVMAGHPGAVVGGMGGVVAGHPGMGGVVAGHPGAVVGGMVAGHPGAVVGGMVAGHPGAVVGGMGGIAGTHPGMVGAPCTVVGGSPGGMVGGMGGVMGHGGMVGGMGGPVMVAAPAASGGVFLNFDGKMTMQNLNDRLANYLDKVRRLEEENAELESNIREFYAKQDSLSETKDYSHYHQQIDDLKNQLIHTSVENNKLLLSIDNNKLTADDFRTKYETECCLRQNVEADINGLHQILDQLSACRGDLDIQCENLQDELCSLKKNHTEEIACLKKQCTGDVNVEVNTCPGPDLKKILEEMRCKYEAMIEGNRKEVEAWYGSKIEEVNRDVSTSSQEIEESNNKVTELRRQLQALEIEYDAQCNLRDTLDVSLAETEHRYNSHLGELQERISGLEQQLAELRAEMECQNHEYTELLDVKSRLEQEISTYRGLLEGSQHDIVGGGGITRVSSVSSGRSGELRSPHTYVTHSAGHSFHAGRSHH